MPPRARSAAVVAPARLRVRMYQVGFGDCFLLSFEYANPLPDGRNDRHLLIDFGSTSLARGRRTLLPVAELIREHTSGQLDVVVVTHRHKDHLSAFGSPPIVELLAAPGFPKLVVRSWTEDPTIAAAASAPAAADGQGGSAAAPSRGLVAALQSGQQFAAQLAGLVAAAPSGSLGAEVRKLADDQLANREAIEQLERWSQDNRGEYLHYGIQSRIDQLIPGIGVRVLGPPTVDQHPAVATQRERDPTEFWMLYQGLLQGLRPEQLLGRTATTATADDDEADELPAAETDPAQTQAPIPARPLGPVGPVRWLTDRMGRQQLNSLLRIVRILDTALNNTSVILLFEVPAAGQTRRLLFGGDAQIENWEYALKFAPDKNSNLDRLRHIDLYKVGHHGSRNATPRTLFNLWTEPDTIDHEMVALLSTKAGVHGKSPATAVPRKTLVAALDTRMTLYSTRDLPSRTSYVELLADLDAGADLVEVTSPP